MNRIRIAALLALGSCITFSAQAQQAGAWAGLYSSQCAVCHGEQMEGAAQGVALIGELTGGTSVDEIAASIAAGSPDNGMPAWQETMGEAEIRQLAIYIAETRAGTTFRDFKVDALVVPGGVVATSKHSFRLEVVAEDIGRYPYSIAPLPDGQILYSEKTQGVMIIGPDGAKSGLIEGAPLGHPMDFARDQIQFGTGYVMDVALHPDFADNGWIYVHFGDRCDDCLVMTPRGPRMQSMNKLVRGRIEGGAWVDEEVIWAAEREHYTESTEMASGGRIAFDPAGYVFISIGMKAGYDGIQDLRFPYGKIHRVHDDGRIPEDNPFVDEADAYASTWTLGHRSPQGLEFDVEGGVLWQAEMGPRGGDEVNRLEPGRNYGWPWFSKGVHYNGLEVGHDRPETISIDDIEQPIVDFTPGPAVSSLVAYRGDAFPRWRGDLLVGTLKGTTLYRVAVVDGVEQEREPILGPLARSATSKWRQTATCCCCSNIARTARSFGWCRPTTEPTRPSILIGSTVGARAYRPLKSASRRSRKALTPSPKSCDMSTNGMAVSDQAIAASNSSDAVR